MILKAKHHFFIYPFFQNYALWKIRKAFHAVHIVGTFKDENLPVLVIANHTSWWDGFWMAYLNKKKIHRQLHFMMLEKKLRKHWYFNYAGGYSVQKKTRSLLETIDYTAQLLKSSSNMVFMFPQGKIASMHETQIRFESGIEKILSRVDHDLHILFVANIVDFFSHPKPILYIHLEAYQNTNKDKKALQLAYNTFYAKALNNQKNRSE